jgi:hypothetical protein
MTTSDFIEGISIDTEDGHNAFVNTDKMILQLLSEIEENDKPAFLILDDIHRVNLAGVLGELLFAFLNRGESITLASGKAISVPENLYVFMTMNTLQPEFSLESTILGGFQISYMENNLSNLN